MRHKFVQDPTLPTGFSMTFRDRFWSKVIKNENGCWGWSASKSGNGYGKFGLNTGGTVGAHVVSWIIHFGLAPKGLFVCHHCDNPECTKPDHLFTGTSKENTQDMMSKGRNRFILPPPKIGTDNPSAKLKDDQILKIRSLYVPRIVSQSMLAKQFGVTQTVIGSIVRREAWTHI